MAWRIELTATAVKQLGKIDRGQAKRILDFLRQRLATQEDPRRLGRALSGPTFGDYWRYRVGDYRLICEVEDGALRILVIEVGHRSDVYR